MEVLSINLTVVSSYKHSPSHPYVSQTPTLPPVSSPLVGDYAFKQITIITVVL
jgi:hypothetical protein